VKTPWAPWLGAATFAAEAQWVIALRLMRLAAGGAAASTEAQRMVVEKAVAAAQAQVAAATALALGRGMQAAARTAGTPYRRAVRANRRRLMRKR